MSEIKNSLFEDLDTKKTENTSTNALEMVNEPPIDIQAKQLVSQEELSQIKKRQIALKEEPQVQTLAEKIDVNNQIAILEFGKDTATEISKFSDRMLST
ncbi:toxic anion resistance protein, partial [Butyricicoccus sp. 1XD8-22]